MWRRTISNGHERLDPVSLIMLPLSEAELDALMNDVRDAFGGGHDRFPHNGAMIVEVLRSYAADFGKQRNARQRTATPMHDPLTITAARWEQARSEVFPQHVATGAPVFITEPLHVPPDVADLARHAVQVVDVEWLTGADDLVATITIDDPVDLVVQLRWDMQQTGMADALMEAWRRNEVRLQLGTDAPVVVLHGVTGPVRDVRTVRTR